MIDLETYGEWGRKGATLSDKTARKEYGLTQEEIIAGIRAGKLQYREGVIYGAPWLRLLRREVEALVRSTHGTDHLKLQQAKTELARVNKELKEVKARTAELEKRKAELKQLLG